MADASIHMTWGIPVVGRESQGLAVFQEALAFWAKQKEAGNIETMRVGMARAGTFGALSGYMLIEGASQKLDGVMSSEDYRRLVVKASHIVENISITVCDADAAVPASIERLIAVRKQLGIS